MYNHNSLNEAVTVTAHSQAQSTLKATTTRKCFVFRVNILLVQLTELTLRSSFGTDIPCVSRLRDNQPRVQGLEDGKLSLLSEIHLPVPTLGQCTKDTDIYTICRDLQ